MGRKKLNLSNEERRERRREQLRNATNNNYAKNRKMKIESVRKNYEEKKSQKRKAALDYYHRTKVQKRAKKQMLMLGLCENRQKVDYLDIGDMEKECEHCGGLTFKNEISRSGHSCCHQGKIVLPPCDKYPETLRKMLYDNLEINKHFRENIRIYNGVFAFASFNAQNVDLKGSGPYSMRIVGEAHVKATTSLASEKPQFGQIYIYDDGEAMFQRTKKVKRDDVLKVIQPIMNQNRYAQLYRSLHEIQGKNIDEEYHLSFYTNPTDHPRVYNKPTCQELAAIISSKDGSIEQKVDIRVYPKGKSDSNFLSFNSPHTDPMLFPLLFPTGETGWTFTLTQKDPKKRISPIQYYGYKLAIRKNEFNQLLSCQRLTQHYIINAYLKVESNRLFYLRRNQKNLRTEHMQGLMDHIQNSAINNSDKFKLGKAIILPSSYRGSPRAMQQLYHDAMAISRTIGRPDVFITMTCNPNWPEIKRFLKSYPPGTTASDIPTFVCRLFYLKCVALIEELDLIFGGVRAYVYTIEFQKRGLPHMHLLVTLNKKLLTADDIDQFVKAEIPNRDEDADLWYKVIKHMSHGPHLKGKSSTCWDAEKETCSKKFPKDFQENTDMTKPGFPLYRRRDNRKEVHTYHGKKEGKFVSIDNSMIVPYNPYLLKRFDCHMNVEYCASVMSIKYIYKYIHKGHDRARIVVSKDETKDEIQQYLDTRYVSAMESAWHIMELPMHDRSHPVELMPIHLPGQQQITFEEKNEIDAVSKSNTKLLAYFELNKIDENARKYSYVQIPLHYRWDKQNRVWKQRKNDCRIIARANIVSPRDVERFSVKLLLREKKGATSFEELLIVDGERYNTFQAAARAAGLSKSPEFINEMMNDAASIMMPKKLRHFFVCLLNSGDVDACALWEKFKCKLGEDSNETTALSIIQDLLEKEGMTLQQFGLPEVINENEILRDAVVEEDLAIDEHRRLFESMSHQMNEDQLSARDAIGLAIQGKSAEKLFFIDGPGGTGKTFLYKALVHMCKALEKKIITIAWTGIAAILLPYGRTAHKTFNLPLQVDHEHSMLSWNKKMKQQLQDVEVIIWDEASMIPQTILSIIDRTFRDIYSSEEPFAGKVVILGGDFRQVLPVVKKGGQRQILDVCLKMSPLWNKFRKFELKKNMRALGDSIEFANWLLDIGNNKITELEIPDDLLCADVFDELYPFDINVDEMSNRAILAARNDEVKKINLSILHRLSGDNVKCHSIDTAESVGSDDAEQENVTLQYPPEYLNSLTPSGLPPAELNLKVGCIVMLLRNLCITDGLCNGTRLVVRRIMKTLLVCEILTGDNKGDVVHIPRITLDTKGDVDMPYVLKRLQFPVRLAFAMTINKAQGQSFEKVGLIVNSEETIFTHGQLYVALSRCKNRTGIKIQCSLDNKKIKNIVFEDAILK